MKHLILSAIVTLALLSGASATELAATPLPSPLGQVMEVREGERRVVTGDVASGTVILSVPLGYRRTGVSRNDAIGRGLFASNSNLAPAGSPGFWAGQFTGPHWDRPTDLWCLMVGQENGVQAPSCFLTFHNYESRAARVVSSDNPYRIENLSIYGARVSDRPDMEERSVQIGSDLRFDVRLRGWDSASLDLETCIGGLIWRRVSIPRAADGSATFEAFGKILQLTPSAEGANVRDLSPPA